MVTSVSGFVIGYDWKTSLGFYALAKFQDNHTECVNSNSLLCFIVIHTLCHLIVNKNKRNTSKFIIQIYRKQFFKWL